MSSFQPIASGPIASIDALGVPQAADIIWPVQHPYVQSRGYFYLRPAGTLSRSPYTGAVKGISAQPLWVAQMELPPRSDEDATELQGFMARLQGVTNTVLVPDFKRREPRLLAGTAYAPLVAVSAAVKSTSVTIKGLPVSTNCFKRGEIVSIGGYCYQLDTDQASDDQGEATLLIQPGLRTGVAANDPVTIYTPRCRMRWANSAEVQYQSDLFHGGPVTLQFVEDPA